MKYLLLSLVCLFGVGLLECGPGMQIINGVCGRCARHCLKCDVSTIHNCLECQPGYVRSWLGGTTDQYVCTLKIPNCAVFQSDTYCTTCVDGYFPNADHSRCAKCYQNCAECTSSTTCSKCNAGFQLKTSCAQCNTAQCAHCPNDLDKCTICNDGYYVKTTGGVTTCAPCIPGCKTCTTATTCDAPYSGFSLSADKKTCTPCGIEGCNTCTVTTTGTTTTTTCTACSKNNMIFETSAGVQQNKCDLACTFKTDLYGKYCYTDDKCPAGFTADSLRRCRTCGTNCKTCAAVSASTSDFLCQECNVGFVLTMNSTDWQPEAGIKKNTGLCKNINCYSSGGYTMGNLCFIDGNCPLNYVKKSGNTCAKYVPPTPPTPGKDPLSIIIAWVVLGSMVVIFVLMKFGIIGY